MKKAFLLLACLAIIALNSAGSTSAGDRVLLKDSQNYTKNDYGAFASPWSAKIENPHLLPGKDFDDTIEVTPETFPNATVISWRWPSGPPRVAGVYGYMHLFFGNYDGGIPPTPVTPVQVRNLKVFNQDIAFEHRNGDRQGFNILNEFWLTRTAGKSEEKSHEIGFMLHTNSRTIDTMGRGDKVGDYHDSSGRIWSVVSLPGPVPFIIFAPATAENVEGSIDVKKALFFLIEAGTITGDEWINGIALGVEPHFGAGSIAVERWRVNFK